MTAGDVLEMLDERVIHRCTAQRADDREGLRGNLCCIIESPKRAAT